MNHAHLTLLDGKMLVGRAEWCSLESLGIPVIKAKIDTGAKTSALHAMNISHHREHYKDYVTFSMNPIQGNHRVLVDCKNLIVDERVITSSNGATERRFIIETIIVMGRDTWSILVSLSNREPLRYRLLLGREALRQHVLVDPSRSCVLGKISTKNALRFYG